MPLSTDVHVNGPLTNMSLKVAQSLDMFLATKVFPPVRVAKESDLYYVYTAADLSRDWAELRGENTEAALADYAVTDDNYFCNEWSAGKDVSKREFANSDVPLKPEADAVDFVTRALFIRRERLWSAAFIGTGIWGTDVAGQVGAPGGPLEFYFWSDIVNGTPLEDVEDWKALVLLKTGIEPNTLVVTNDVWKKLKSHPTIKTLMAYNSPAFAANGGKITTQMVADMMELDQVFVSKSVYNTAAPGLAASNAYIAGSKSALLIYAAPNPGISTASAGYNFLWTGADGVNAEAISIIQEPVPNKNTKFRIEGSLFYDAKIVSADLGLFATTVIA